MEVFGTEPSKLAALLASMDLSPIATRPSFAEA